MVTLRTLFVLFSLPVQIFKVVVQYYLGILKTRKYNANLIQSIRREIYRCALSVHFKDGNLLYPYSKQFLVAKIIPFLNPTLVKPLPGFGKRYDSSSFWLVKQPNPQPTDSVIIYSHGGGYFIQLAPSQIQSLLAMYWLMDEEKRNKTSILILDYTLVSEGKPFPTQMGELHQCYTHLLKDNYKNIILMGDSAGGNLSVGYTQYLKTLSQPVVYPSKLILISPWVKLVPDHDEIAAGHSWFDNERYDYICYSRFHDPKDIATLIGNEDPNSLIVSPGSKTPRTWKDWSDIPTYSDNKHDVLLVVGEDESFRDDVLQWAQYALGVTFPGRKGDPSNSKELGYEAHRRNVAGRCNLDAYVDPEGIHDAVFFFEQDVHKDVTKALKAGKQLTVKDIDDQRYFAIARITKFLNETI